MTETTTTEPSEFDFDSAPPAGQTLTDQQPEGAAGGKYAACDDVDMSEGGSDGPAVATPCKGSISAPRYSEKEGRGLVIIDTTVFEPSEHAGYEAALFCTVKGGTTAERQRGLKDIAKLCKALGVSGEGKLSEVLGRIAEEAAGRDDVPYKLAPKRGGGHFVNL